MSDYRGTIRARIRKLLELTPSRGCTESEALSAARKAAELMAEYGITAESLEFENADVLAKTKGRSERDKLWPVIAYVTNCAAILLDDAEPRRCIRFVGTLPGVEIAAYLWTVCDRAIDTELKRFRDSEFYRNRRKAKTRRSASEDFIAGMVSRLSVRLYELFEPQIDERLRQQATIASNEQFPSTRIVKRDRKKSRDNYANFEGWRAGGRPQLEHGVRGGDGPALIGSNQ